jgi:lipoprotein-releasing system permease protein
VAIAVTTAALVVILSAMNGLTGVVAGLYNTLEPDIRISAAKGKFFKPAGDLMQAIRSVDGVLLLSQSITDKALAKSGEKQAVVTVKGIDADFRQVTGIDSAVVEGSFETRGNVRGLLLGKGIAEDLGISMAVFTNEVSLLSPVRGAASGNPDEQLNQFYFQPSGLFSLNEEFDYQYVFTDLRSAGELFDTRGEVSSIEVKCEEGEADKVARSLKQKLGESFVVKTRYELNEVLFKSLETEKIATFFILAFILVIATFNIIGALTMLIIEKKKDIRTLFSLGADLFLIRKIFMREGIMICGIGALSGLLLGLFVCWLQIRFHLVTFGSDFIIPYYPIELRWQDFAAVFALILVMGTIAALYPVRLFTSSFRLGSEKII